MKKLVLSIAVVALAACGNQNQSEDGYQTTEHGLKYKFHNSNPEAPQLKSGEIATFDILYKTDSGEVLFDSRKGGQEFKIKVDSALYNGDITEGFLMMHVGDSATFVTSADSFFTHLMNAPLPPQIPQGSNLTFEAKLLKVQTLEELQKEQMEQMQKAQEEEQTKLQEYLTENNITAEPTQSGLYYIEEKKGTGKQAEPGKQVKVHYTGTLLDGTKFDSSVDRGEPIEFVLGVGQVIPGWDEGISYMKEGGKAKLIIPSHLAYGGRQTGPIPPFSTLVFEVELLEVSDAPQPQAAQ
ncbi:MAG TPA: peptidylprolyl isomerase [Flavobacteriales bacterium]|nr:peptidylprolyl isomerase [Flavobacteriales bacterium]|tara:strand:+ start:13637 stop:14524 length:888 start_codon:yes stop_codon:yes gene_type:complete